MATSTSSGVREVSKSELRRAIFASFIGTTIEWYDFFLYGTAAALVLAPNYFPKLSPFAGLMASFATFSIGFLARPVGAIIFGHLGDKIGRKTTLVATLLIMGIATFVIGLLPTYQSIGIAAPIILTLCRLLQGFGVGGEWGGSVLLAVETGYKGRRSFYTSAPQIGVPAGLLLSTGVFTFCSSTMGPSFMAWGWRIPFLLSFVLVFIGLYIRLRLVETPVFQNAREQKQLAKAPIREALSTGWRDIAAGILTRFSENSCFYLFCTYSVAYGVSVLHLNRNVILTAVNIGAVLEIISVPILCYLGDIYGRTIQLRAGNVILALFAVPYYMMLHTGNTLVVTFAIVVSIGVFHSLVYATQASLFTETFNTRVRYSAASMIYQFTGPLAGGTAPFIAALLVSIYGADYRPLVIYIVIMCCISFIGASLLKDTKHKNIIGETAVMAKGNAG